MNPFGMEDSLREWDEPFRPPGLDSVQILNFSSRIWTRSTKKPLFVYPVAPEDLSASGGWYWGVSAVKAS